jgi:WD40 repeat protein
MTLRLPGRLSATLLMTGMIAAGLLISSESTICWRAAEPRDLKQNSNAQGWVRGLAWSADGNTLLSESRGDRFPDFKLTSHDLTHPEARGSAWAGPLGISAFDATLSPKAHKALLATERGDLWWVDLVTFETTGLTAPPREHFRLTAVSHDEGLFAAATDRGHVYVYEAKQGTSIVCESPNSEQVSNLRFSNDDQQLLTCRWNGAIEVWDAKTGTLRHSLTGQPGTVIAAFLQDGTKLISSFGGSYLQITNLATGEVCWKEPHGLRARCVCYLEPSLDGSIVAWSAVDNQVVIWDLEQSRKRFEIDNPSVVMNISVSPDSRFLAVAGCETVVRIYDTSTGLEVRRIDTGSKSLTQ